MPDIEKVIYSIERCICHVPDACRDCAYDAGHPYNECVEMLLRDALELLSDPDRVKVVRCRDCVEWEAPTKAEQADGETFGHCRCRFGNCYGQLTDMNWFCADGEREE